MRRLAAFAALLKTWGPGGAFLLAMLDSAGVPLPAAVDATLLLVAIEVPSVAWWTAVATVIGSTIGATFLYWLGRKGGEIYLHRHTLSPRGKQFREWFEHYGLMTVFIPKLVPIPLPTKVFVLSAGALGVPPRTFILTVFGARVLHYFGITWLGVALGRDARGFIANYQWHMAGFVLVLIIAIYLAMRSAGNGRVGGAGRSRTGE